MNYLKIYTLLLCAVLIAACSDDEEQFNSGAATVNLQETAMTVKEDVYKRQSAQMWLLAFLNEIYHFCGLTSRCV